MADTAVGSILRDARLVAGKDLRLEWRTRVTLSQLLPFSLLVLVLFAFALDPDRRILGDATPGLFWLAVLFSTLLAIQRAFAVETVDGIVDALRLSGLDPAGVFLGKAAGIALHLLVVEVALGLGYVLEPLPAMRRVVAAALDRRHRGAVGEEIGDRRAGAEVLGEDAGRLRRAPARTVQDPADGTEGQPVGEGPDLAAAEVGEARVGQVLSGGFAMADEMNHAKDLSPVDRRGG